MTASDNAISWKPTNRIACERPFFEKSASKSSLFSFESDTILEEEMMNVTFLKEPFPLKKALSLQDYTRPTFAQESSKTSIQSSSSKSDDAITLTRSAPVFDRSPSEGQGHIRERSSWSNTFPSETEDMLTLRRASQVYDENDEDTTQMFEESYEDETLVTKQATGNDENEVPSVNLNPTAIAGLSSEPTNKKMRSSWGERIDWSCRLVEDEMEGFRLRYGYA